MQVVAFTGAGISKESGIDTFQDRPGIRDKLTRTFATNHPEEYRKVMKEFCDTIKGKEPNNAHKELARAGVKIITMNVDGLHEKAGSYDVLAIHGRLPEEHELPYCESLRNAPVLYGDKAPRYQDAFDIVYGLQKGDYFLVIGASTYTGISVNLRWIAEQMGATVIEIQDNASIKVGQTLQQIYGDALNG